MPISVTVDEESYSFEVSDEERRRLEAAIDRLGVDPDVFFTKAGVWAATNAPELADEVGAEYGEAARGVSESRRRELKREAKAAYLKRRSLRFAEFVLEGDGVDGSQGNYLDARQ